MNKQKEIPINEQFVSNLNKSSSEILTKHINKIKLAIHSFKKAMKLEPDRWGIEWLIDKIDILESRKKELETALRYIKEMASYDV